MNREVGIRELRQNLSKYLRRVKRGERLVVTERNRPVAALAPVEPVTRGTIARMIAEGTIRPAVKRGPLPDPLEVDLGEPDAVSKALDEVREDVG